MPARPRERSLHGLTRKLIANMVTGVSDGLHAACSRSTASAIAPKPRATPIQLTLGYSHPIVFQLPQGVQAKVDKQTVVITLEGADRQVSGETAARDPQAPSARALQGQGHQVRRGEDPSEGRQGRRSCVSAGTECTTEPC